MSVYMRTTGIEGRLEYIDVVRWQDGEIHVLGRGAEIVASESTLYMAYHFIYDSSTGKLTNEESFLHRGSFPLFMCGCYMLSCEGNCPPILDHKLSLDIKEYRVKADKYDDSVRQYKEANINDLRDCNVRKT